MGIQTWTCKISSTLSPILSTPVQSSLRTNDQVNETNKLSPDSKMCDTSDMRVRTSCHNIWMVTVCGALVYYIFIVGLIYFYPNTFSETQKDPLSGFEKDVPVRSAFLVTFSISGIVAIWFGSVIQIIKNTNDVKLKPGSYSEVCHIQTAVVFVLNLIIGGSSPIMIGIFHTTLAWPLYVFGIGMSLKVIHGLENTESERKPTLMPILVKDDLYLHESQRLHGTYSIWTWTRDEIRKCEKEPLGMHMKEINQNSK